MLGQSVEGQLEAVVLQVHPRRVLVVTAPVRISAFVQHVAENLFAKQHFAADQNSVQFSEFRVQMRTTTEIERAPIADQDVALFDRSVRRFAQIYPTQRQGFFHRREPVKSSLLKQKLGLVEPIRQAQTTVAQKIQHVTKQIPVTDAVVLKMTVGQIPLDRQQCCWCRCSTI
ncbi:hypothetical protein Tsp_05660 [Trichinella spiralis]|uniref:hypothetical protein n=1 Tax=Trichinella spiralis TaxID=6334 RepID=UPI0001EFE52E|nr:hypothetical protein Tsp_05660 [Trichinella spiralis]